MNRTEISTEELELLAASMAQALSDIECPECCECGWAYQYMELSAQLYREEYEWACLAAMLCACGKSKSATRSQN